MRLAALMLVAWLPGATVAQAQGTTQGGARGADQGSAQGSVQRLAQGADQGVAPKPPALPAPPPGPATALPPISAAATLAAALPMQAAGFTRGGLTDFESRPGGTGLGAAAEYRPSDGSSGVATLYQYTRGIQALPEGTASPLVEQEIQSALSEIRSVGPLRRYGLAKLAEAPPIPAPGGQPVLRCMGMLLVYEGGSRAADSFVCAGVLAGRFLKLRLTLPTERQGETQPRLLELGRAVVAALVKSG